MKQPPEIDPLLGMIDAVLGDIAVRSVLYLGRRREDGDANTLVIQFGEGGRLRFGLPDRTSESSIVAVVAEAQARLTEVLGAPVPQCPQHTHAMIFTASSGRYTWVCPDREWQCRLGDYAEMAWPNFDRDTLGPILAARLQRRDITGWVTLGVKSTERGPVAEVGVAEMSDDLSRALRDAAAPLPVSIHETSVRPIRVSGLSHDRQAATHPRRREA